jgi:hypothetical protein
LLARTFFECARLRTGSTHSKETDGRGVTTYFPNATNIDVAEVIDIREGPELSGYEIRLRSSPVYRLRGIVLDEAGEAAPRIYLAPESKTRWGGAESTAVSGPDGRFEFRSVPAGQWQICATSTQSRGVSAL